MTYQVLARKWRPQNFEQVVGQESVTRTLQRALETERVAHAYLFTGSRGIGKTTIARILAKALSCQRGVTPNPCGECSACVEITAGKSVDVVEIDGASNTGVEDIRELREATRFLPQTLRFRIFIIDEVHMLSTGAFNALLKTLEEPPPHVKFVFATTEVHKIPVTILSRCQRYDFKRMPTNVIVARLQEVLAAEGAHIDAGGLALIARAAEGGMRDALSLTDQVLSFAGQQANVEEVTAALGLIDRRMLVRVTQAALARDARDALACVEEAFRAGHDLKQLADGLAAELRHLSIACATGTLAGFADLSPEDVAQVDAVARGAEGRDVQRLFAMALEGIDRVARSETPRLALELMLLRMCDRPPLGDAIAISDAITRLDALARGREVPPPRIPMGPAQALAQEALAPPPPAARASAAGASPTAAPMIAAPTAAAPTTTPPTAAAPTAAAPTTTTPTAAAPTAAAPTTTTPTAAAPTTTTPTAAAPTAAAPKTTTPTAAAPTTAAPTTTTPPTAAAPTAAAPTAAAPMTAPPETADRTTADRRGEDPAAPDLQAMMARMARAPAATPVTAPDPGSLAETADEEDSEPFDPALGYILEDVDERWLAFVRQLASVRQRLGGVFAHGRFAGTTTTGDGLRVKVAFETDLYREDAERNSNDAAVLAALSVFGPEARLMTVPPDDALQPSIAAAQQRAAEKAQAALEAHARSHPVVQKALTLFGGEVRQVRAQ